MARTRREAMTMPPAAIIRLRAAGSGSLLVERHQLDALQIDHGAVNLACGAEDRLVLAGGQSDFANGGLLVVLPGAGAGDLALGLAVADSEDEAVAGGPVVARPVEPDSVLAGACDLHGPGGMILLAVPEAEVAVLGLQYKSGAEDGAVGGSQLERAIG